jgi:altronate hydrolase
MDNSVRPNSIVVHRLDNVAVALMDMAPQEMVIFEGGQPFPALEAIPRGHKVALEPIPKGQMVRKYGEVIGAALQDIPKGALVHTHNMTGEEP